MEKEYYEGHTGKFYKNCPKCRANHVKEEQKSKQKGYSKIVKPHSLLNDITKNKSKNEIPLEITIKDPNMIKKFFEFMENQD